jgi:ABC-type antimicrobial peptide transport system permease subunit
VLWLVLRQVLVVALAGVAVGVPITIAAGPLLATLLFGLGPHDLPTLIAAALLMLGVALAAGWVPARRAARLPVLAALRRE